MAHLEDDKEAFYAKGRRPERFYVSRRFQEGGEEASSDAPWHRFAYQVCDESDEVLFESEDGWSLVVRETPIARQQLKALFFEDSRRIAHLVFQRFQADGRARSGERFTLSGKEITNFAAFLALVSSSVQFVEGDEGVRLGPQAIRELLKEGTALQDVYEEYGDAIRELIAADVSSPEVTALARRRSEVGEFERLLTDPAYFDACRTAAGEAGRQGGAEAVWQAFFERNQWIFGTGLAPQFLHSWNPDSLEQPIAGATAFGAGKRADGLLRTAGALSALVFVEIKTHTTELLHPKAYRRGAWRVSEHVAGGVAQCQAQVDMTVEALGREIERTTVDGWGTGEVTSVCRPRSILVIGRLDEFVDEAGAKNLGMFESFERFRRSISDPEIVTFDELFARARTVVTLAESVPVSAEGPTDEQ